MNPILSRLEGIRRTLREDGTLRTVLKNTGWLTGSSGVIMVLSLLQGVLTARLLGLTVWGMLAVAMSFSMVSAKLLSFRMNSFVVKWVTQLIESDTARAATAFKLALAADVATALIAFALVETLSGWGASAFAKNPDFVGVFRFVGLIIVFQAGRESLLGMLQVNRDFRVLSFVQAGCQVATVCGIAVVYLAGWGLSGVVAVLVGAEALTAVLLWTIGLRAARVVLAHGWMGSKLVRLGELAREMWGFAILTNISGTLSLVQGEGDLLLLGFLSNPMYVAYYKLARSMAQVVSLPMMPLVDATYPEFGSAAARGKWGDIRRLMRRGSKLAATWYIPACLGAVVVSPFAISVLYGTAFSPAAPVLDVLLIGVAVDGLLFWTTIALLSMGEPGYVARNGLEAATLKIVLALLLVPMGGALAMAFASSSAMSAMNLLAARHASAGLRRRESATLA